ncbi:MAG: hypothetical protein ACI8WW_000791 [Oceanospirillaceae bacterium]|jgi:hypothetical protein
MDIAKLDCTYQWAGKYEESEERIKDYWATKTMRERLEAAFYLNSVAYNFDINNLPKMDRTVFSMRKITMGNIFNSDFRDFIQALNNTSVDYLLIGGYSVILHGYVRTTGDVRYMG